MATPAELQALLNGPAAVPPPGVVPNFVDPANIWKGMTADIAICLTVTTLAVCMRTWTKFRVIQQIVLEDYVCWLAYAVFVPYCAITAVAAKYGGGTHQWDIQLKNVSNFFYYIRLGATIYGIVIFLIKLTIFLQILRIFVPNRKGSYLYWACHSLIWMNFVFYLISSLLEIFSCTPIRKAWDPLVVGGHCLNVYTINVAAAAINTTSDLIILLLPQHVIWRLQMSLERRIGISAIFFTGILACASSATRLYYTVRLSHSNDVTYFTGLMGLLTLPEMASGFLVACLPVSPRFFQGLKQIPFFANAGSSLRTMLHLSGSASSSKTSNDQSEKRGMRAWRAPRSTRTQSKRYLDLAEDRELGLVPENGLSGSKEDARIVKTVRLSMANEPQQMVESHGGAVAAEQW